MNAPEHAGDSLKGSPAVRRPGPAGPLLHPILLVLSLVYRAVTSFRNLLYDRALFRVRRAGVPVISVGNLTVGGTGKTPLVAYLVRAAAARGFRPAVVARGYRGVLRDGELINDEGLLLEEALPGLIVVQDPDRVAAAEKAVSGRGADLVVLDDAFQHRRIARDVNIVTLDGRAPIDNGCLLPAGLLREAPSGLRRADALVLTRCGGIDASLRDGTGKALARIAGGRPVFFTDHAPETVASLGGGEEAPATALAGRRLFLFAGIAHPDAFRETVLSLGAGVAGVRFFPDHHRYGTADVERIRAEAEASGADGVITTAKDGVKLKELEGTGDVLVLHIAIRFLKGEEEFLKLLFEGLGRKG